MASALAKKDPRTQLKHALTGGKDRVKKNNPKFRQGGDRKGLKPNSRGAEKTVDDLGSGKTANIRVSGRVCAPESSAGDITGHLKDWGPQKQPVSFVHCP